MFEIEIVDVEALAQIEKDARRGNQISEERRDLLARFGTLKVGQALKLPVINGTTQVKMKTSIKALFRSQEIHSFAIIVPRGTDTTIYLKKIEESVAGVN
ncbi:hypothetical protein BH10ACI4_BH10ACI4_25210 [soil metagenome]